ncbi:hemicentin-1-like [Pecten maximus]|uniref:hemicentin-1-like n=1 Tax=Pecten maximus TaxID=6579 RepID=UPI001458A187|nr:hemicentin-1-like [Pecten maximus]
MDEPVVYDWYVFLNDAVTLTGSSEYAVPGTEFTLTCDVPEEANVVQFYRRPDVTAPVGAIQIAGDQCYNTQVNPAVPCTPDVCSCVTSGVTIGTVFRWIIQPQTGDRGSMWFCRRINLNLPDQTLESDDYTLNVADGPGTSIALSPSDTTYTRTEGDTLPDITCTADCRPGCTFVWTRPDNTNFTVSSVLSLGQLDRSEHGTYRCTARNVVGESSVLTSVTVQYRPSVVRPTPPNLTYTLTEGQTIPTITCSADCNPVCTYSWTKDGQTYTTGSGIQLTSIQRAQGACTSARPVMSTGVTSASM